MKTGRGIIKCYIDKVLHKYYTYFQANFKYIYNRFLVNISKVIKIDLFFNYYMIVSKVKK